jgi:hypothetical protein
VYKHVCVVLYVELVVVYVLMVVDGAKCLARSHAFLTLAPSPPPPFKLALMSRAVAEQIARPPPGWQAARDAAFEAASAAAAAADGGDKGC